MLNCWNRLYYILIFLLCITSFILQNLFCLSFRNSIYKSSSIITNDQYSHFPNKIIKLKNKIYSKSNIVNFAITEFSDEDVPSEETVEVKTHGYEGDFNVGDIVKVTKKIKIWSVKPYTKEGFECQGFVGKVNSLALYGRKFKTLCSAITPVKVEFEPTGEGIPSGMFERKWIAHFAGDELELIKKGENQPE